MEIGQGITISGGTAISTTKPSFGQNINFLLVAGGGGGGGLAFGGGGGGGGFVSSTTTINVGTNYNVIVGAGGGVVQNWPSYPNYGYCGDNGANTTFNEITAVGGGGGGNYISPFVGTPTSGNHGGSGGGGTAGSNPNGSGETAGGAGYDYPSPTQQGYPGGYGRMGPSGGGSGGGGGAGGSGGVNPGRYNVSGGGNGGIGRQWWDGNYYAGGGAGASNFSAPGQNLGGLGGGGNSGVFDNSYGANNNGANAAINTGGGGGGAAWYNSSGVPPGSPINSIAGQGGSGIAIFSHPTKIPVANTTGSPNVTYVSGNIIYKFNQSGTIRWDFSNSLDFI